MRNSKYFVRDSIAELFEINSFAVNYEEVLKLDDNEFAKFYLEMMEEYRDFNGWWTCNKIPKCLDCDTIIKGPSNLRRYCGQTRDAECFERFWENERRDCDSHLLRKYFDRVAKLRIN